MDIGTIHEKLKAWLFSDSAIMFVTGWGIFIKGVSFLPDNYPGELSHPFNFYLDDRAFAIIWFSIGLNATVASLTELKVYKSISFSFCVGLLIVWGIGYSLSKDFFLMQYGSIYISLAIVSTLAISRGNRSQINIKRTE